MTVYPLGSNGNVTPVEDISGSNTNIYSPEGVAVDAAGHIFISQVQPFGQVARYTRKPMP